MSGNQTFTAPRQQLAHSKRWVVKIGSSMLTKHGTELDRAMIKRLVTKLAALRASGKEIVLVSSGAVAVGTARLGWSARPESVSELQAAAAIGQSGLIQAYEEAFSQHEILCAQVLLDHDDIASRERYLNARSTLRTLLELNVIPIINENDTVVTDEIRFGDNDTLAAMVTNLIDADALCIITDQLGMYDKNPSKFSDASLLSELDVDNPELQSMAGGGGQFGRGGMLTKVQAARLAAQSGAQTLVMGGDIDEAFTKLLAAEEVGTLFINSGDNKSARKQWLSGHKQSCGKLILDQGAAQAVLDGGNSLLPVGVTSVEGEFQRGDLVDILALDGRTIAKGLISYPSDAAKLICGKPSSEIVDILGYHLIDALVHRDNLVLV